MEKILSLHTGHDATAIFINERDMISKAEKRVKDKEFLWTPKPNICI